MPHCIVKEGSSSSWDYCTGKHTTVSMLTYMWIEVGKLHNGYVRKKKIKIEKYLHSAVQLCSTGTQRTSLVSHSLLGGQERHSAPTQPASEGLQRVPGSVLTQKEEAAPNCKTEILITKRNKSSKKSLLLKPWDKTRIRLVSHLLIITFFLCKDFWLVILNELLEDSHILTLHRRGDKNNCNIEAAQLEVCTTSLKYFRATFQHTEGQTEGLHLPWRSSPFLLLSFASVFPGPDFPS